jgi:probable HAF family extracellular repeat protein
MTMRYSPPRSRLLGKPRLNPLHPGKLALIGVAAVGLSLASAAPALATTYTITDVGNLGYPTARAGGINESGQVAGTSYLAQRVEFNRGCPPRHRPCFVHPEHPFLWSEGKIIDLGTLSAGLFAEGTAINSLGEVAGFSNLKNEERHAFVSRGGKLTDLSGAGQESHAYAINDSGVAAGDMSVPLVGKEATLWSNGKVTNLGLLPGEGGIFTVANGINDSNEVVGSGDNRESMERAFLWRNGTMTDIGTLGGPQATATAINNAGQIVGSAQTSTDAGHGFIFQNGRMTDLGLNIYPNGISNNGVVVGQGGCGSAVIVTGGICQNLQNLIPAGSGYTLQSAKGVNNRGQIVVEAQTALTFQNHTLVLNPN